MECSCIAHHFSEPARKYINILCRGPENKTGTLQYCTGIVRATTRRQHSTVLYSVVNAVRLYKALPVLWSRSRNEKSFGQVKTCSLYSAKHLCRRVLAEFELRGRKICYWMMSTAFNYISLRSLYMLLGTVTLRPRARTRLIALTITPPTPTYLQFLPNPPPPSP